MIYTLYTLHFKPPRMPELRHFSVLQIQLSLFEEVVNSTTLCVRAYAWRWRLPRVKIRVDNHAIMSVAGKLPVSRRTCARWPIRRGVRTWRRRTPGPSWSSRTHLHSNITTSCQQLSVFHHSHATVHNKVSCGEAIRLDPADSIWILDASVTYRDALYRMRLKRRWAHTSV